MKIIDKINKYTLNISSFKSKGRDDIDFKDIAVVDIKNALQAAFDAGKKF